MAFMLAAKRITHGRIVTRRLPITHTTQFGRGEQLQLPHQIIFPHPGHHRQPDPHSVMPT
jgi:hypothetical protein